MNTSKTILVWLRNELRTHDNTLLHTAKLQTQNGGQVLPVFVFDPEEMSPTAHSRLLKRPKTGPKRVKFVLECVQDLRKNLSQNCQVDLLVAKGPPEVVLGGLAEGIPGKVEVVCGRSVCSEEMDAENKVEEAIRRVEAAKAGGVPPTSLPLRRIWDSTLIHPSDIPLNLPSKLPNSFTQFRTVIEKTPGLTPRLPSPTPLLPRLDRKVALSAVDHLARTGGITGIGLDYLPPLKELVGEGVREEEAEADKRGNYFDPVGGETGGLARLRRYFWEEDRLRKYFETRNGMVGQGYSTKFAPWLAKGCLSPRYIASEKLRYEKERVKNKSTYWVIFELLWRDYFIFFAQKHGRKLFFEWGVKGVHPVQHWSHDRALFEAWREGKTGVPVVDSNMRELKATGFMSNRGRQLVASFLVQDLKIDWRWGAEYFEEQLVDYAPEPNWGNWHSAAGLTGGRAYHFNPVKQGLDHDQDGTHTKLWCPELAALPPHVVHQPWTLSKEEQKKMATVIGEHYPRPIYFSETWGGRKSGGGGKSGGRGGGTWGKRRGKDRGRRGKGKGSGEFCWWEEASDFATFIFHGRRREKKKEGGRERKRDGVCIVKSISSLVK